MDLVPGMVDVTDGKFRRRLNPVQGLGVDISPKIVGPNLN